MIFSLIFRSLKILATLLDKPGLKSKPIAAGYHRPSFLSFKILFKIKIQSFTIFFIAKISTKLVYKTNKLSRIHAPIIHSVADFKNDNKCFSLFYFIFSYKIFYIYAFEFLRISHIFFLSVFPLLRVNIHISRGLFY